MITSYSNTISVTTAGSLLLDAYPGAAAAYSLRQLRGSYTGDAIRVRRASDNTELNIGFVNNVLDTASLTTFCSGTNGFVTRWYDQSGNAYNATQTTAANQPQIYDSLNGVILENAKPSLDNLNSGSGKSLSSAYTGFNTNDFSIFYVQKIQSSTVTTSSLYMGGTNDLAFFPYMSSGGLGARIFWRNVGSLTETNSGNISNLQVLYNIIYNTTNANWKIFRNTNQVVTQNVSLNLVPNTNFNIGGSGGGATYGGKYQELIIYPSDKSSDITGISNNINNFYSIY
jgi:hypothetical protein